MPGKLSRGESEAILLAKELDAYLLVDELEARKEASRFGISYSGSLRIIKEAKNRRLILKEKPVLDELIASGTYLDENSLSAVPPRDGRRGRRPAEEVGHRSIDMASFHRRDAESSWFDKLTTSGILHSRASQVRLNQRDCYED
jgi:hypothetical protein